MTKEKTRKKQSGSTDHSSSDQVFLILHNDDVHTFDFVIEALIDVCDHEYCQASQCALITHTKGRCEIRKGHFNMLKPMKDALINRELNVTIE